MALSHSARLDRIPAYPTAAGYELPEDVAMLASNESHDPPIPEVVAAVRANPSYVPGFWEKLFG